MTNLASMKHLLIAAGLSLAFTALTGRVQAQAPAHYVPGTEGLMGASLPPPGFYFRDYNLFYVAEQLTDLGGNKIKGAKFDAFVYAQVPRVIWVTNQKILGGDLGASTLLPFVSQNVAYNQSNGRYRSETFGVGDLLADGFIAWHPKPFDFVISEGFYAPTGNSSAPPTTRVGQGFWSNLATAGVTWNSDAKRSWTVSVLNRFENSSEQRDTNITPGDAYTLEWGISKSVTRSAAQAIDLGVVGYYQQKVTGDTGDTGVPNKDRVAGIGPEVDIAFPKAELGITLRYEYEFIAENRAQGQTVTLTLTKRF